MSAPYDPKNIICHTCWEIENQRRGREEPFRNGEVEVRRLAPQEPVWIDGVHYVYLHCRDHIPPQFFEGLTHDSHGKACETCGITPAPRFDFFDLGTIFDDMIRTSSGRTFCSIPHIPFDELKEKSWVRVGPCEGCGREIHRLGGQSKDGIPPRLFCSSRCHIRFYDLRKQARRAQDRPRPCSVCGTTFEPRQSNAITCSSACRQKAYRQRQRATG